MGLFDFAWIAHRPLVVVANLCIYSPEELKMKCPASFGTMVEYMHTQSHLIINNFLKINPFFYDIEESYMEFFLCFLTGMQNEDIILFFHSRHTLYLTHYKKYEKWDINGK